MNLKNKKILVTGADGFIGSHLTELLMDTGCQVRAFVCYNSFNSYGWLDTLDRKKLAAAEIVSGDVRDPNGVRNAVKGCDVVLHLAALIAIPFSYQAPDSYVDTNVKGTLNILNAARDLGVEKVVVTSTSEVYGTAQYVPINEKHPLNAQSPYAATKIAADQMALSFYRSFGTPVAVLRPFNTYGPRQSARAIIPTIITQLLSGRKEIRLGNTAPTRDLTFVLDTARGFVANAECDSSVGQVINIGNNSEISVGALAEKIKTLCGTDAIITTESRRLRPEKSEVERLWADNSLAASVMGWKPQVSLDEGITRTIEWFRRPENLSRYKSEIYNV